MQIYLVGGAVRDQLLGLPVKERDWVVVGASPEQMVKLGFQPVGKEFPVFLHPETKEEYALARTERKVGQGYKGFVFHADGDVSLEQDLLRRDLTVNAIAQTDQGELIDPFQGRRDLQQRVLRHVSPAFAEDPVRILRLARFSAKLPDFSVHPQTMALMQQMVADGEVDALVAERVWQELCRSLLQAAPLRFWQVLEECGALSVLFPELVLNAAAQNAFLHAIAASDKAEVRFSALLHQLSPQQLKQLCRRSRAPKVFSELALLVAQQLLQYQNVMESNAEQVLAVLKAVDAMRRPQRFADFLLVCQACCADDCSQQRLQQAAQAVADIATDDLQQQGLVGEAFALALRQRQLNVINKLLLSY